MALRPVQVNIKALDHAAVGRFWADALGWSAYRGESGATTHVGPAGGLVWPDPVAPGINIVPVPQPKTTTKNRLHLDLASTSEAHQAELVARLLVLGATPAGDDKAAEAARLRRLGATDLDVGQGDVPWTCLMDSSGHEFCVLAQSS